MAKAEKQSQEISQPGPAPAEGGEVQPPVESPTPANELAQEPPPVDGPEMRDASLDLAGMQALEVGSASATWISQPGPAPAEDMSLVKVLVRYPTGYAGKKYLVDEETYIVSPESAADFVKRGFATIVK